MKKLKWIFGALFGLIILLVIALGIFLASFDLNDYKAQIQTLVKDHTGRDLDIKGDLSLSVFPWVGVELGEIALSNAKGFGTQPFAQVGAANIKVEVLPLFRQEVRVDVVELRGLSLSLQTKANGVTNWDDLTQGSSSASPENQTAPQAPADADSASPAFKALSVGGLDISDANVQWDDASSKQKIELTQFSLKTGQLELGQPLALQLGFVLKNAEPALTLKTKLKTTAKYNLATQVYALDDLILELEAQGSVLPGGAMQLSVAGNLAADLRKDEAQINNLKIRINDAELTLDAKVTAATKTPLVNGSLKLQPLALKEFLQSLQLSLPATADSKVLSQVMLQTQFSASNDKVALEGLSLQLDDTKVEGAFSLSNFAQAAIRADLKISGIDLDRYLPPETDTIESSSPSPAAAAATADDTIELPVDLLRSLDVQAGLAIGQFKVKNVRASNINIQLKAKDGRLSLAPLSMALYDGLLQGSAGLDVSSQLPRYTADIKLAGVQSGPLLQDFMQDDFILGRVEADVDVGTQGNRIRDLKSGLNGKLGFKFSNGALRDFNLAHELRKAEAQLKGKELKDSKARATDFSGLSISATAKNGVLQTNDLNLAAPLLRAGGKGSVDLGQEKLDYLAEVTITDDQTGEGGTTRSEIRGLPIPVRIKGRFDDLKVKIEIGRVLTEQAREEIQKRLDEEKAKLEAELEKAKRELEAKKKQAEAEAKKKAAEAKAKLKKQLEKEKKKLAEKKKKEEEKAKKKLEEELKKKLKL